MIGQSDFTTGEAATTQTGQRRPAGVAFDSSGSLWGADSDNNRVLEYKPGFSTGQEASTVIGQTSFTSCSTNAVPGGTCELTLQLPGVEPATSTATSGGLTAPSDPTFDAEGNLWAADGLNTGC